MRDGISNGGVCRQGSFTRFHIGEKVQCLRIAQEFNGNDVFGIFDDVSTFARRNRSHGNMIFFVGGSRDGIYTSRVRKNLVF